MASNSGTGKKRTSTSKTSSRGKRKSSSSRDFGARTRTEEEKKIGKELLLLVLFATVVMLFLCNFGVVGPVGNAISSFLFGIFGFMAYIAPIVIFLLVSFGISNQGNSLARLRLVAISVLLVTLMAMSQFLWMDMSDLEGYSPADFYQLGARERKGGGVIGGTFGWILFSLFDTIGGILVAIVILAGCFVILTGKSLVSGMRSTGGSLLLSAREDLEQYRIESRIRRQEQEERQADRRLLLEEKEKRLREERARRKKDEEAEKILRMDRKVSGVMLDPRLPKENSFEKEVQYGDIQEITLKEEKGSRSEKDMEMDFDFSRVRIHGVQWEDGEKAAEEDSFDHTASLYSEDEHRYSGSSSSMEEIRLEGREEEEILPKRVYEEEEVLFEGGYEEEKMEVVTGLDKEEIPSQEVYEEEPVSPSPKKEEEGDSYTESKTSAEKSPARGTEAKEQAETLAEKAFERSGEEAMPKPYQLPPLSCLTRINPAKNDAGSEHLKETAMRLQQTLATFGVRVTLTDISQGPTVTRYELQPEQGVKVSKIVGLTDDIKLNLAATDIRIEAPIPGKAAVGIEVPNKENTAVGLRELLESREYQDFSSKLAFAVGKDIAGKTVVADIAKMPHMLIAGSTGSGKSVCINTLIMSILYKAKPDEVKLIMIDPKVVELSVYNGIPHLLIPVVTDPKKAAGALHWGVAEMTDRYQKFAEFNVRDLKGYNAEVDKRIARGETGVPAKMPQIVIIVDELADLMMVAPGEVEESICRLAQLARAAGIHLIIATQRPSVDVITGLIKANMPSRVAFAVSSGVDSRTILDMNGAEKLLGKGDMLFYPQGYPKPARMQGAFVSDDEVGAVVDFLKNQSLGNVYHEDIEDKIKNIGQSSQGGQAGGGSQRDSYFEEAGRFIIEKDKASIGMLQRVFKIGFNRAARIMDQLAEAGVVGEEEGTKPRKVLMSIEQFETYIEEAL